MVEKISDMTPASTIDNTEEVEVTQGGNSRRMTLDLIKGQRSTLVFSAGSSSTWSIPAGTRHVIVIGSGISGSTSSQVLSIGLNKQSDSTAATFEKTAYGAANTPTSASTSASTSPVDAWNGGTNSATTYGVTCNIIDPRTSSYKTLVSGQIQCVSSGTDNQEFRSATAVADTAEDHDEVKISVDAGTITGTFHIVYW